MATWTVLPFLGVPVPYEAEEVEVAENGDLLLIAERDPIKGVKAAVWAKDKWARVGKGEYPFEAYAPQIANRHPSPYKS